MHLASALVAGLALAAISWWLPLGRAVIELRGLLEHAGPLGPLALLLLYVLATLALIPGALVMIVAGAVLAPGIALLTMTVATVLAAAAGFGITRHLARGQIERVARRSRRLTAWREAMADGGFGVLVLLRLTPVVPYGLSNYVFGLTPVRVGPFVLASWIAMIPTTVLYTMLGHTGGESIVALQSGLDLGGEGPLEWLAIALGFGLRWLGVLYVARRTRQRLAQRPRAAVPPELSETARGGLPVGPLISAGAALMLLVIALAAYSARDLLVSLPGPEAVVLREVHEQRPDGPVIDHGLFDQVLAAHVDEQGRVDYAGLARAPALLDAYVEQLGRTPFDELGRDEKLALLLNAYNAFTLRLVLDHWPLSSILEIPYDRRWEGRTWRIGEQRWTLAQIEQEQCRGSFVEPRVHFALSNASLGGAPLWNRAFRGAEIEEQLAARARYVHSDRRWFEISADGRLAEHDLVVGLTRIYAWYRGDFEQVAGTPLSFAARHSPRLEQALESGKVLKIRWLPFDWRLNGSEARGGDQL